jgi:hypothetical protein
MHATSTFTRTSFNTWHHAAALLGLHDEAAAEKANDMHCVKSGGIMHANPQHQPATEPSYACALALHG